MKIECTCGATIHDAGDSLPDKAHVIPDKSLFPLLDAFDDIVLNRCNTAAEREAACTHLRSLLMKATGTAWQCTTCGRLYIDGANRQLNTYAPEGQSSKSALS